MLGHQAGEAARRARGERPQGFAHLVDREVISDGKVGRAAEWLRGSGMECLQGCLDVLGNGKAVLGEDPGSLRERSVADCPEGGAPHGGRDDLRVIRLPVAL